jgi:ribosomal-protein-alanine N-acetyltransferase
VLREWQDGDNEAWFAMNADPRVMEFFPHPYDRRQADESATRLRAQLDRDGYGWWVAEIKGGARFAGVVALQDVPFEAAFTPAKEIGWRFAHAFWGHGYATEGAAAALNYAFNELGWSEVVAMTAALNTRSQRVMQRLGMTHDPAGDFDHPRIAPGHPLRPHVLYRVTSPSRAGT